MNWLVFRLFYFVMITQPSNNNHLFAMWSVVCAWVRIALSHIWYQQSNFFKSKKVRLDLQDTMLATCRLNWFTLCLQRHWQPHVLLDRPASALMDLNRSQSDSHLLSIMVEDLSLSWYYRDLNLAYLERVCGYGHSMVFHATSWQTCVFPHPTYRHY